VVSIGQRLCKQEVTGMVVRCIRESDAQIGDRLLRMTLADFSLTTGGIVPCQFRPSRCEGAKEKGCDSIENEGRQDQDEECKAVSENDLSFRAKSRRVGVRYRM
jgi:hypothetical protein